jgi:hypothetical protein
MNASQLLAWLLCLALAFFASALAVRNGYRTALLERELTTLRQTVEDRQELLQDIHGLLQTIDGRLEAEAELAPAAGASGG